MKIGVVTLFPEMFKALDVGITGRALKQGIIDLHMWNPRDFTEDLHRTVDDRPYGGGPGMVMQVMPLLKAIQAAKEEIGRPQTKVLYLSPQGRRLQQKELHKFAACHSLILVAGRYEGIDERLIDLVIDEEISVGDYILTGGELPAMVMIDGITRLLPGALGDETSATQDSFGAGGLDCPHYTRPEVVQGLRVPEVLLSGDHEAIRRWRLKQSLGKTWLKRPDILAGLVLSKEEQTLLDEFKSEQGE